MRGEEGMVPIGDCCRRANLKWLRHCVCVRACEREFERGKLNHHADSYTYIKKQLLYRYTHAVTS